MAVFFDDKRCYIQMIGNL